MQPQEVALRFSRYLMEHPEEILGALKNAAALRIGIPLDAVRWFIGQLKSKKVPKDLDVAAVPPGLRVVGTLRLMGNEVRVSSLIFVDKVQFDEGQLRAELRLSEVVLRSLGAADSPIATLLKSGALDLSKPGNLLSYLPKKPAIVVDSKDDRITLDLMKHPAIAGNAKVRRGLRLLTPLVTISAVETYSDHLSFKLRLQRGGLKKALLELKDVLI
ncbi:MAG TPA: hypothetical protein VHO25_10425 [Polyangiaceae bacterium]|nr:hypothetical protein [Polyangiaceae bacterium]